MKLIKKMFLYLSVFLGSIVILNYISGTLFPFFIKLLVKDSPKYSTLVIKLSGSYADIPYYDDAFSTFLDNKKDKNLFTLLNIIDHAANDPNIKSIILNVEDLDANWATIEEIRGALTLFKRPQKSIVAYLPYTEDKEYYLVSVADQIYMPPQGISFINGISLTAEFYKSTLDKIGIYADMHHIGKYKNATDGVTRSDMSDYHKEVLNSMADNFYLGLVEGISNGRNLSEKFVSDYIDNNSSSLSEMVDLKIITQIMHYGDVLNQKPAKDLIYENDYLEMMNRATVKNATKVAMLYITGEIISGENSANTFLDNFKAGSETIIEAIDAIANDDEIKALILRIDSPGGSALASDDIWRSLMSLKGNTKKPIVVSMSNYAASGGYWIATAGDKILADKFTLTGSIGVIFGKYTYDGLLKNIGANVEVISRGKHAAMFNPLNKFTPDEVLKINRMLTESYTTFLNRVSSSRKMEIKEVDNIAQGRVWTGKEAFNNQLVDQIGGIDEALDTTKKLLEIPHNSPLEIIQYPQDEDFFTRFRRSLSAKVYGDLPNTIENIKSDIANNFELSMKETKAIIPFYIEIK